MIEGLEFLDRFRVYKKGDNSGYNPPMAGWVHIEALIKIFAIQENSMFVGGLFDEPHQVMQFNLHTAKDPVDVLLGDEGHYTRCVAVRRKFTWEKPTDQDLAIVESNMWHLDTHFHDEQETLKKIERYTKYIYGSLQRARTAPQPQ